MKHLKSLLAACAAALLIVSSARAAEWTEDYASAAATAKKEHKYLLLDFTGSDWCSWCKRIDKEVFATDSFKAFADKQLILVKVDFPRSVPQSDAVKAQTKNLSDAYGVEGYPTLVVLDADQKVVFKQDGYEPGGAEAFIAKFPKAKS